LRIPDLVVEYLILPVYLMSLQFVVEYLILPVYLMSVHLVVE